MLNTSRYGANLQANARLQAVLVPHPDSINSRTVLTTILPRNAFRGSDPVIHTWSPSCIALMGRVPTKFKWGEGEVLGFKKERNAESNRRYASNADYCRIFQEDMRPLYLLCFLLTANHARAEQCYLETFDKAIEGNLVFKEWARSWTQRTLIQNAIHLVFSDGVRNELRDAWDGSPVAVAIHIVTQLAPLERFAFVMSVLERYSDHDCSRLLNCTVQDVRDARVQALRSLETVDARFEWPLSGNKWNVRLSRSQCA